MKKLSFCLFIVFSIHLQAQESQVIPYEKVQEHNLTDPTIDKLAEISRNHVIVSSNANIEKEELQLLDVELVIKDELPPLQTSELFQRKQPTISATCFKPASSSPILNFSSDVGKILDVSKPKKKKYIYFSWGYHRGWHSKSDATFKTAGGTFTVHGAIGHDRPSMDPKDYYIPSRISIPQYNLRIGYEVNDNWDIVAGLDHMKWVFQRDYKYEFSGDYNHTLYVAHPSGDPHLLQGLTFDEVKATGDARWLSFEHTNGYNYAHLGAVYKTNLFTSRNQDFKISTGLGAGLGLMIPQTSVHFHQDGWWNWEGVDNNFHIAGYGGHAEAKIQFAYKNFFLEPMVRGTVIKVENALVNGSGASLEHTPIGSIQVMFQGGYKIPLKERQKKRLPSGN
jgi:hypothetical protein